MIHLCTIATLMFLQNNTSQKILFIAARTIQFPGVVFKVCIYLIVAIVTSSIYFDVKSTHTYRKYIYQQSLNAKCGVKVLKRRKQCKDVVQEQNVRRPTCRTSAGFTFTASAGLQLGLQRAPQGSQHPILAAFLGPGPRACRPWQTSCRPTFVP